MNNNFEINAKIVKENAEQFKETAKALSNCVNKLENVRSNLSMFTYDEIKGILKTLIDNEKTNVKQLNGMEQTLEEIVKCYEEAERKIAGYDLNHSLIKDIYKEVRETIKDLLDDILKMLKGDNPDCCEYGGDPINFSTGNFIFRREYLRTKGIFPMEFKMYYNSMDRLDSVVGNGWTHNYQVRVKKENQNVVLYWSDGREDMFVLTGDGEYSHVMGKKDIIKENTEGFIYRTLFGIVYFFDKDGKNIYIEDSNGNKLEFSYDQNGRLIKNESVSGEALFYQYNTDGMIVAVYDHEGRSIQLSYDNGKLIQVIDEENYVFQYRYDDKGNISGIINGRNIQTITNTYDDQGRVTKQSYPDGGELRIEYNDIAKTLHVTEQNGNTIDYIHDDHMRSIETVFADGSIQYAYNDQNKKTQVIDKRGNKTSYHYDKSGNLIAVENPLGEKMEMTYNTRKQIQQIKICGEEFQANEFDEAGNLTLRKDALGRTIKVIYNDVGKPMHIIQPDGSSIHIEYDKHGNICCVEDPQGNQSKYEYDNLGQVTATIDGNGNRTEYFYNQKGYIVTVKNAEGNTKHYTYNESSKVVCIKDFDGSSVRCEYNCINKPGKIIDQKGNATILEYDKMYNVTRRIEANGAETKFVYDKLNRLVKIVNPVGGEVCYEYDSNGNRTKITDSDANTVKMEYDALNRLITVEDADGAISHVEYNQFGQRTKMIDAMGNERTDSYNKAGERISSKDIMGNETRYLYNELGKIREIIDPAGRKTTYSYLPGGLLERITYGDGTFVSYTYDSNRNVKSKKNQEGYTLYYSYDSMNRIVQIESSEGQKIVYRYDAMGNVVSMTDALGNTTKYNYLPKGELHSVTDALGNCTEYQYDKMGKLTDIYQYAMDELASDMESNEDAKLHFLHYDRDILGQVQTVTDALGEKEHFQYDHNGRLVEKVDRDGFSTHYRYTNGGQLSEIQYEDGNSVKFSYNLLKQLTQITDWLGITTFELDQMGRAEQITDHEGKTVKYNRGNLGQCLSMEYPGGHKVHYGYDELMRLVSVRDERGEFQYHYNECGKLIEKILPNGIKTNYTYNITGTLAGLQYLDQDGILDRYEYQYDLVGNKLSIDKFRRGMPDETGNYQYDYDAMNRLINVKKDGNQLRSYGYDAFGNRVFLETVNGRTNYHYNEVNQMIRSTDEESIKDYIYDGRGNLTSVMENGIVKHSYNYDVMNHMVRAEDDSGCMAVYGYNGIGQRVQQQIFEEMSLQNGKETDQKRISPPTRSIKFIWDYSKRYHNLLMQEEANQSIAFLWDGNLAAGIGENETNYYLTDEMGTPLRYLNDRGDYIENYTFDEFGNDNSGEKKQPFGYAGLYKDTMADTYYAQAREYMPRTGRFTSKDIIKGIQAAPYTMNEYSYCWNRPLNFVDRDGAFPGYADIQNSVNNGIGALEGWIDDTVDSYSREISATTGTFFNVADYVWENYVPAPAQMIAADGGNLFLKGIRGVTEIEVGGYSISDGFAWATQTEMGTNFLNAVDFERTEDGVYHSKQDCWQDPFGYNAFYDYVFDGFTSTDKGIYSFHSQGTEYTIWMWKGDYYNLGAGAETGIYRGDQYHKESASDTNLRMALSLYDKNTGEKIFSYNPSDPQWWNNGFNPAYQDYKVDDLEVHVSIDFSEEPELWDGFYGKYEKKGSWCFDEANSVAYYQW